MRLAYLTMLVLGLAACDRVTVNNSAGEVGLFVDGLSTRTGQQGLFPINDFRLSLDETGSTTFRVGNYRAAPAPDRNEVIGFGEARAPTRLTTPWTEDDDSFNFALGQPIAVDLTFWVLQGPLSTAEFRINNSLVASDSIWEDERAGVFVGDVDIIDARDDPDITNAMLNSVGGNNRDWDAFSDDIGFDAGRINVYWINTVEGSATMGWSDFGPRIVMGAGSTGALLTHEIGHAFNLVHPEEGNIDSQFNSSNVMTASSLSRSFLTEGQVFRAHFEPGSAINATYGARPGQPVQSCDPYAEAEACPALQRRIWADGSAFAPN